MGKLWGFPSNKHTALSPPILSACFLLLSPSTHSSMALYSSPAYTNLVTHVEKHHHGSYTCRHSNICVFICLILGFITLLLKKNPQVPKNAFRAFFIAEKGFELFNLQKKEKTLPAPKRPIGEDDIQAAPIRAVPEQRRRRGIRLPEMRRFHDGAVVAVEHQLQIRQLPRVGSDQLRDSPHREHSARLNRRPELLHVHLPVQDDEAEMRRRPRFLHHPLRYSSLFPVPEVLVNPSEKFRAGRRFRRRVSRWLARGRVVSRAGVGVIPRGAVQPDGICVVLGIEYRGLEERIFCIFCLPNNKI